MYCNHCGKEINDNAVECPYCGGDTKNTHNNDYGTPYVSDNGGIGWGLLGCCIPLAGLILFYSLCGRTPSQKQLKPQELVL